MESTVLFVDIEEHVKETKKLLKTNFLADSRPWVVAYSGGKDSTLTLQLVYELLLSIPEEQRKPVHILASDTRVESPNIESYIQTSLEAIQSHADQQHLNIATHLIKPEVENSFWSSLIGKGYPPPTRTFRWCTSKMKIKPVRSLIQHIADDSGSGSVILLLGTRKNESASRSKRMSKRELNNRGLNFHHEIPNALVLQPIAHWETDQVWEYLYIHDVAPWGSSHDFMLKLYRDANSGECPVVTDLDTPSCGGSRFGCWTCTVVKDDKSMRGFIEAGNKNFELLYNFRAWLKEIREDESLRNVYRRNGQRGPGPFNSETRKLILERLLQTEQNFGKTLISDEEINYIQKLWNDDFDIMNSALRLAVKYERLKN